RSGGRKAGPQHRTPANQRLARLRRGPRTAAVTITLPSGGTKSLSEVITRAEENLDLADLEIEDVRHRRARTGGLLLEISGPEREAKAQALAEKLKNILGEDAKVVHPCLCAEMRVYGLGDAATPEKVAAGIAAAGGCAVGEVRTGEIRRPATAEHLASRLPARFMTCALERLFLRKPFLAYLISKNSTMHVRVETFSDGLNSKLPHHKPRVSERGEDKGREYGLFGAVVLCGVVHFGGRSRCSARRRRRRATGSALAGARPPSSVKSDSVSDVAIRRRYALDSGDSSDCLETCAPEPQEEE
ncbi:hypothetical protein WH47_11066, partial [Habropoda laboriosa]